MPGALTGELLEGLVALTLLAYLYGAIPFAYVATHLFGRRALTDEGTGNVGVINAFHTGGVGAVVITLLGEISKGAVCVGLAEYFFPQSIYVKLLLVLAAFVGTNYSVFLRGRGGRGSTMLMWSIAFISLPSFLILIAIIGTGFFLGRTVDVRLKSLWFWLIPVVLYLVEKDWVFALFGVLVAIVVFVKSRQSRDDLVHYGYVKEE
jgi:glycerol-3-phosphate acyltransferase PlsY